MSEEKPEKMGTKQILEAALKDAIRSSNDVSKRTIRMILANIKLSEVEKGSSLDETEIIKILQKDIKIHNETIRDAEKAGRVDLIHSSQAEIAILETFLPKQLSESELKELVLSTIQEIGAVGPADMGKVMKNLLPKIQDRALNDVVSKTVREMLNR